MWIVGLTRPNQEGIAEVNLTRQGFAHYVPKFKMKQLNKPVVIKVLFPRYIFIFITDAWYSILSTRGISRILLGDLGPQSVRPSIIEDLKSREIGGFVQLEKLPRFVQGDQVKVDEGPLSGHLAVFEGMAAHDRVRVLMSLLGRKVSIELDEKVLSAA